MTITGLPKISGRLKEPTGPFSLGWTTVPVGPTGKTLWWFLYQIDKFLKA
jgi:hypothetical protein